MIGHDESVAYDKRRKANAPLIGTERVKRSTQTDRSSRNRHNARRGCRSDYRRPIGANTPSTQWVLRSHNGPCATLPLSSSMFPLKVLSALVALLLIASVRAETNVTIDDTDPRIYYRPSWSFQGDVRSSPLSGTRGYSTCAADGQHARSV